MKTPTRWRSSSGVAVALAAAAGIHVSVAGDHYRQSAVLGGLFVAVALMQLGQALAGWIRPTRRLWTVVAASNAAVVAAWAASRTSGLPVGPHAGTAEPAGLLDIAATALAVAAALGALRLARRRAATPAHRRAFPAGIALVALSASALGFAAPAGHGHAGARALRNTASTERPRAGHPTTTVEGVHLHPLREAGDRDPGRDPARTASSPLDGEPIPVGRQPVALTAGAGSIWVANRDDATVTRIDTATRRTASIDVPAQPTGLTFAYGAVWVASYGDDVVVRIDPATNRVVGAQIPVGVGPTAIAAGASGIWVATTTEGDVQRIDPRTGRAERPIHVGYGPTSLVVDRTGVWVTATLDRTVVHVDPTTRRAGAPIAVGAGGIGIASGFGRVWATSASVGTLTAVDPRAGAIDGKPIAVDDVALPGLGPVGVTAGHDRIWVANNHDKTVAAVDPATRAVGRPLFFDNRLAAYPGLVQVVESDGAVWVTNYERDTIVRIPLDKEHS